MAETLTHKANKPAVDVTQRLMWCNARLLNQKESNSKIIILEFFLDPYTPTRHPMKTITVLFLLFAYPSTLLPLPSTTALLPLPITFLPWETLLHSNSLVLHSSYVRQIDLSFC